MKVYGISLKLSSVRPFPQSEHVALPANEFLPAMQSLHVSALAVSV